MAPAGIARAWRSRAHAAIPSAGAILAAGAIAAVGSDTEAAGADFDAARPDCHLSSGQFSYILVSLFIEYHSGKILGSLLVEVST